MAELIEDEALSKIKRTRQYFLDIAVTDIEDEINEKLVKDMFDDFREKALKKIREFESLDKVTFGFNLGIKEK